MTSAIGGQPGTLMIGLPVISFCDRLRAGRIRLGGLHATVRGARSPGDDRLGIRGGFLENVLERLAANGAVHAAVVGGRVAFDSQNVLAFVLLHDVAPDLFHLEAGGRLQRVVVVERDHVQDDVLRNGVRGANERFAAAGALQAMQPQHRNARLGLHGFNDLGDERGAQAESGRRLGAKFQERPTVDSVSLKDLVGCKCAVRRFHAVYLPPVNNVSNMRAPHERRSAKQP